MSDAGFKFSVAGKVYDFDITDVDGKEARLFRKAVGLSITAALQGIEEGSMDVLEALAGLKWLVDRRENADLAFDDVLDSVTYGNIDMAPDGEAPDPANGESIETSSQPSPTSSGSDPGSSTNSPKANALSS